MGTWITHLRIAENLLDSLSISDTAAFTFGNLSPDSGIPNADWTQFDPPKTVTHYLRPGEGEGRIQDMAFYRGHLAQDPQNSFLIGYFCHLICDNLWSKRIVTTTKEVHAESLSQDSGKTWKAIKRDWYGLDHRYVRNHPDCLFWTTMIAQPNPPVPLPFLPENAVHQQLDYIRDWYSTPNPRRPLDRAYPYLNQQTLDRFVDDCTHATLRILERPEQLTVFEGGSALSLLPPEDLQPYPSPLGDE